VESYSTAVQTPQIQFLPSQIENLSESSSFSQTVDEFSESSSSSGEQSFQSDVEIESEAFSSTSESEVSV
jgi:tripartite-type tricarboxylate transporter receptor subunit TctC